MAAETTNDEVNATPRTPFGRNQHTFKPGPRGPANRRTTAELRQMYLEKAERLTERIAAKADGNVKKLRTMRAKLQDMALEYETGETARRLLRAAELIGDAVGELAPRVLARVPEATLYDEDENEGETTEPEPLEEPK